MLQALSARSKLELGALEVYTGLPSPGVRIKYFLPARYCIVGSKYVPELSFDI